MGSNSNADVLSSASAAPPALSISDKEEINILVTGFGQFSSFSVNPSYLIARSLPTTIYPSLQSPSCPRITLHVHPDPVRVSYRAIRTLIPELLSPSKTPVINFATAVTPDSSNDAIYSEEDDGVIGPYDAVLHIGMANGHNYYACEAQAHRDGYEIKDVDGETMQKDTFWKSRGAPPILKSAFQVDGDVWRRWKRDAPDLDLRPSFDPGHYCCDFIYYTSLYELWRTNRERRVIFLHVPGATSHASIERGTRAAVGLIRAMVETWESEAEKEKKKKENEEAGEEVK
ncbi:MAG: hypothetical protein M1834_008263 [Cirrosporium novae-zelandiae]|nr:MAG: hypothetical protein M1834_008263 [Cirrosporium novae-zelandiae]